MKGDSAHLIHAVDFPGRLPCFLCLLCCSPGREPSEEAQEKATEMWRNIDRAERGYTDACHELPRDEAFREVGGRLASGLCRGHT